MLDKTLMPLTSGGGAIDPGGSSHVAHPAGDRDHYRRARQRAQCGIAALADRKMSSCRLSH